MTAFENDLYKLGKTEAPQPQTLALQKKWRSPNQAKYGWFYLWSRCKLVSEDNGRLGLWAETACITQTTTATTVPLNSTLPMQWQWRREHSLLLTLPCHRRNYTVISQEPPLTTFLPTSAASTPHCTRGRVLLLQGSGQLGATLSMAKVKILFHNLTSPLVAHLSRSLGKKSHRQLWNPIDFISLQGVHHPNRGISGQGSVPLEGTWQR